MWIEVLHAGKKMLFNSDLITLIDPKLDSLRLEVMGTGAAVQFTFETEDELMSYYEGFVLALNGMDFVTYNPSESTPLGYIKPLLRCKDEALYNHIRLKEVLGDRTR